MGKLTNRRYYLDYNSTSPLAKSVKRWLTKGDFDFMNPSSGHTAGKRALAVVKEVEEFLRTIFKVDHDIFFHSGATEGNNTIIKGWLDEVGDKGHFFYGPMDHPSVRELAVKFGDRAHMIDIDSEGDFELSDLIAKIKSLGDLPVLVNYTVINNETGVHWPLEDAVTLKQESGCYVHVDSSQLVGKIDNWANLSSILDAYTFSGHKFGALKGVGFSFYRSGFVFSPLLQGGGQQRGVRSGTINTAGIYSLKLALDDIGTPCAAGRNSFEAQLQQLIGDKGQILCSKAKARSNNTTYFIIFGFKPEILLAAFDLAGLDVSSGSACSSGIIRENSTLRYLGFDTGLAISPVRISFSPKFSTSDANKVFKRVKKVLMGLLKQ